LNEVEVWTGGDRSGFLSRALLPKHLRRGNWRGRGEMQFGLIKQTESLTGESATLLKKFAASKNKVSSKN